MATLARLNVALGLNTASLQKGLTDSRKKINDFGKSMTRIGGVLTGLGAPIALMARSAINAGDEMAKMSQRVGVSVERLSTLRHAAQLSGSSLESMETGLGRLSRNLLDAERGLAAPARAFEALGISVTDAEGKLRNTDDIMGEVADKFAAMEDGTEKTALAMELFGRSGAQLIPMLNQGADGISRMEEEARKLGLEISTETAQASERFNDALTKIGASLTGVANALLSSGLLDSLTSFANRVAALVARFSESNPLLLQAIGIVGIFAAAIGPVLIALGMMIPALAALAPALTVLFGPVGLVIAAIGVLGFFAATNETVRDTLGDAWEAIQKAISTVIDSLKSTFEAFTRATETIWKKWGTEIKAIVGGLWRAVEGIFKAAFNLIKGVLSGALGVLEGSFTAFAGLITGDWEMFTSGLKTIWTSLWEALKAIVTAPIEAIKSTVSGFTDAVTGFFSGMYDKVVGNSIVPDMMRDIKREFEGFRDGTPGIVDSGIGKIKTSFGGLIDIIKNPTEGLSSLLGGLGDKFKSIVSGDILSGIEKIGGFFGDAVNSIKSLSGLIGAAGEGINVTTPSATFNKFAITGVAIQQGLFATGVAITGVTIQKGEFRTGVSLSGITIGFGGGGDLGEIEVNTRRTSILLEDFFNQIGWGVINPLLWAIRNVLHDNMAVALNTYLPKIDNKLARIDFWSEKTADNTGRILIQQRNTINVIQREDSSNRDLLRDLKRALRDNAEGIRTAIANA